MIKTSDKIIIIPSKYWENSGSIADRNNIWNKFDNGTIKLDNLSGDPQK